MGGPVSRQRHVTRPARPLRPAMAGVHTWAGLLFGWLLYFMFVTGTTGYLDTEIDRWMRPELAPAPRLLAPAATAGHAIGYLQTHAPGAERWTIQLPVDRNEPYLKVQWQLPGDGPQPPPVWLDAASGAPMAVRDTGGGQALYQMHWRLHYLPAPASEWLVALACLALLLALLTGIVVHRRFFADFFTLRLGKGQRSWLDAHNLASVATLPFQLMISYSGLVFVMFSFMPLIASAWYGPAPEAQRRFYGELFPALAAAPAASAPGAAPEAGRAARALPIAQVLEQARAHWGGAQAAVLDIQHPGSAHARISAIGNFAAGPLRSAGILVFDADGGAPVAQRPAWQSAPRAARDLALGLHEGLFAGPWLRALYLLCGLSGCAIIATGMLLWTAKRRQRAARGHARAAAGLALAQRLNVAVILGLPIAIAAYFWSNRLLPAAMDQRAHWEIHVLFAVWLAMCCHAMLSVPARAWRTQAWIAAIAFGALPLLNLATTHRHLGLSLPAGDWVMAGFDLAALAMGAGFAILARVLQRSP